MRERMAIKDTGKLIFHIISIFVIALNLLEIWFMFFQFSLSVMHVVSDC